MTQKYADYTSISAAWLTELPSHWDCKKIGILFSERKTKVSDKDFRPLSVAKIGVVPQLETAVKTDAGDNRKLVRAGDFVINSRSDRKGSCGLSELDGSVSLINIVLTPRSQWNGKYVHYLMRSQPFSEEFYRYGRGIVSDLWTTRFSEMKNILLPIPPRSEQDQIVRFLDWKVSSINKLISNKKKRLTSLKELKKAFVDQTIKNGIQKHVYFKDSNVYWIGSIPCHWTIMRLKNCVTLSNDKTTDNNMSYIGMENIESWTGKRVYSSEIKPEGTSNLFAKGNVLFGKLRPYLAKAFIADNDGICSGEFLVFKNLKINTRFLFYYLVSPSFIDVVNSSTYGAKMPRANWSFIGNCAIVVPPASEQEEIVDYLDNTCSKIDVLINNTEAMIGELYDLKNSIIAKVVTGKIDVRDVEIPDYEFIDEDADTDSDSDDDSYDTEEQED